MSSFQDNNDLEVNNLKENSSPNELSQLKSIKGYDKSLEYILYNNNFFILRKPLRLGGTRNILYINNYPYISIGKNISLPLLVILFICCIYIYVFYFFFDESGYVLQKIFNYCFVIYLLSHLFAIFLNPGIPTFEYNNQIIEDLKTKKLNELDCTKCKICNLNHKLKDKIGHCEKCEICYFGYDHHCIWTGHCVTKTNAIFFILFIMTLFFFILICFAMVFIKIVLLSFL